MAIKTNVDFKGYNLDNCYIRIRKIRNMRSKIGFELEVYTLKEDGSIDEQLDTIYRECDDSNGLITKAYNDLKSLLFTNGVQV